MSKYESSLHIKRGSYHVGELSKNMLLTYYQFLLVLTIMSYTDAQGFKRFLRVTWEPFEAEFQSMETRFTHHTNIVVRLAGAEHLIHYYTRQEGECYNYRLLLAKLI